MNPPDETTELQSLLDRYLADDPSAFDDLISHAGLRLRALTRKMLARYPHVRRWEQTDDVLQLAMIRLHQSLSAVKPESKAAFFGLAATQTRRTLIDLARHYYGAHGHGKNYQSVAENENENQAQALDRLGASSKPDDLDEWTAFHTAVDKLDDEQRVVLSLVWYGGLKQKEIARLLDINERTVIRRLNRAKLALQEIVAQPVADHQ